MGKVRLSKKQAEEIKRIEKMGVWSELSYEDFQSALLSGYEVKPEFKVGDYVINDRGIIVEILEDDGDGFFVGWIANGSMYTEITPKSRILRHATKQESWWAKHGRKVWELREGDVIKPKSDANIRSLPIVSHISSNKVYTTAGTYVSMHDIYEAWEVFTFAEDRKDVDNE